jgi:16S rRNA G966 N2-methylase RsmD
MNDSSHTYVNEIRKISDGSIIYGPDAKGKEIEITNEGLWSVSNYNQATIISDIIKKFIYNKDNSLKQTTVYDFGSGIGGNTWSFINNFSTVFSIENNIDHFNIMIKNISMLKKELSNWTPINCNMVDFIDNTGIYSKPLSEKKVCFLDPPWGLNYRSKNIVLGYYKNDNMIYLEKILKKLIDFDVIVIKHPKKYKILSIPSLFTYKKRIDYIDKINPRVLYSIHILSKETPKYPICDYYYVWPVYYKTIIHKKDK